MYNYYFMLLLIIGFSDVYLKLKVGKERQKVKAQNGSGDHETCDWNHSTTL